MLWAVTAVCAVAAAASLVFSLSAAGHWPGHEGIHLTWVENIPVDLFVLGLTCVWYIYLDAVYYPSATLGLAVFVALAYLFGRGEDYYIPWDCVQRFGEDIILIDKPFQRREGEKKKRRW